MGRNTPSKRGKAENRSSRASLVAAAAVVVVLAVAAATFLYESDSAGPVQSGAEAMQAALVSDHSPMFGDPGAKVHIVEFLDPACGTCAFFYPIVKQWMAQVPGDIRLSVRHVAFHEGADYAVKVLEASRKQDKYWETLEALLSSQHLWTQNHRVLPERIAPAIASVGLDMEQLLVDMEAFDVQQRIEQDKNDAILLKVSATPGYFVNGRPLTSFGQQQLADLIREELEK